MTFVTSAGRQIRTGLGIGAMPRMRKEGLSPWMNWKALKGSWRRRDPQQGDALRI
jgi:hypothetical protein